MSTLCPACEFSSLTVCLRHTLCTKVLHCACSGSLGTAPESVPHFCSNPIIRMSSLCLPVFVFPEVRTDTKDIRRSEIVSIVRVPSVPCAIESKERQHSSPHCGQVPALPLEAAPDFALRSVRGPRCLVGGPTEVSNCHVALHCRINHHHLELHHHWRCKEEVLVSVQMLLISSCRQPGLPLSVITHAVQPSSCERSCGCCGLLLVFSTLPRRPCCNYVPRR